MKAIREGRLKLDIPFEEAIRRAMRVKPPAEGWGIKPKSKSSRRAKKAKQVA